MKIRANNDFWFGSDGQTAQPMVPVIISSKQQAYRTAAWLKIIAITLPNEELASTYEEIEEAVFNT